MKKIIAVAGTGCAKCKQTVEAVRQAVDQACIDAAIEKVEDIREIVKLKVMSPPVLLHPGTCPAYSRG
jgi:hypothetical protein